MRVDKNKIAVVVADFFAFFSSFTETDVNIFLQFGHFLFSSSLVPQLVQ